MGSIEQFDPQATEVTARTAVTWLDRATESWLLIIDNLDDFRVVEKYLPSIPSSGHVLIAMDYENVIPIEVLEVFPLEASETMQFLLSL